MRLTIECECGNKITISALPKTYVQMRDFLESKQFHYEGSEVKDGKVVEFRIICDKCRNRVVLGVE